MYALILNNILISKSENLEEKLSHIVILMLYNQKIQAINIQAFKGLRYLQVNFITNSRELGIINLINIIKLDFWKATPAHININGVLVNKERLVILHKLNKIGGLILTRRFNKKHYWWEYFKI